MPRGLVFCSLGGLALLLMYLGSGTITGRGMVSGPVTIDGKTLEQGTISFSYQDGDREVINAEIRDGKCSVLARSGAARVTVIPHGARGNRVGGSGAKQFDRAPPNHPAPLRERSGNREIRCGQQTFDF